MNADARLTDAVCEALRAAIDEADGNEVCAVGNCNDEAVVVEIVISSRGHERAVPVVAAYAERGDVLIHNHPGGVLAPSDADLDVAAKYAESGLGFYIVDSRVERVYVVTEPARGGNLVSLDVDELEEAFLPGGAFATAFDAYEPRPQQIEMMRGVAEGINHGQTVVVEAGTGVGKSIAYLAPVFHWAALNRERIVISTATINLQQQLLDKDIPLVRRATGLDVKAVLMKGRANYLCRKRLAEAEEEYSLFGDPQDELPMIREWSEKTATGARNDLPVLVSDDIWFRVASESDSCRGQRCARRGDCFVLKARKEAAGADVIVANHHLLFSDLAIRRSGVGREGTAVLPPFSHIVFDEAHNIERNATSFFTERFTSTSLHRNLSRLHRSAAKRTGGTLVRIQAMVPLGDQERVEQLVSDIRSLRELTDQLNDTVVSVLEDRTTRLTGEGIRGMLPDGGSELTELLIGLRRFNARLADLLGAIPDEYEDEDPVFDTSVILRRLEAIATLVELILRSDEHPELVVWVERRAHRGGGQTATFHATPLDVREIMRESVFETYDSVVCTSATLTVKNRFDYFADRVGIRGMDEDRVSFLHLDSPFAYRERVLLATATDAPLPNEEGYQRYVEEQVAEILEISEGRGLVLFTSYRMLEETCRAVLPRLEALGIPVLRQGGDDRSRLLERFSSEPTSVLFATDSFWEGVDAPGDALRVVIICRLPFRVPNDPVLEARVEAIERDGGNAFYELSVPQAVMRLKQGFGRLMRRATDGGVVVILDPRIVRRRYGELFLQSLPETRRAFTSRERIGTEIEAFLYP